MRLGEGGYTRGGEAYMCWNCWHIKTVKVVKTIENKEKKKHHWSPMCTVMQLKWEVIIGYQLNVFFNINLLLNNYHLFYLNFRYGENMSSCFQDYPKDPKPWLCIMTDWRKWNHVLNHEVNFRTWTSVLKLFKIEPSKARKS